MEYQVRSQVLKRIGRTPSGRAKPPLLTEVRAIALPPEAVARPEWYPNFPEVICETS